MLDKVFAALSLSQVSENGQAENFGDTTNYIEEFNKYNAMFCYEDKLYA